MVTSYGESKQMDTATLAMVAFRWQYCRNDSDITGEMYATADATEARMWAGAHGDTCILVARRAPRGKWQITTSETWPIPMHVFRMRWATLEAVKEYAAYRNRVSYVEAVCRCGWGNGECD